MSTPSPGVEVKVLYTFDDQNKSNCLARLPNALSIPTVSLDETTQVGVIELKTCIQAIVSARHSRDAISPELVAKLGHDYTVYAYDFSEYETPLVGQGMLSWILASASTTPNAPAEESQTMVTGRVCKNILGLFSNGVKETLEVKLKLVPVPTCMQSEYVENMERYHSLSKVMPEGMDYKEWADFLRANPAIGQLAQPTPRNVTLNADSISMGGMDSFSEMIMSDSFYEQHHTSFHTHDTRASSPAMSTVSSYPYQIQQEYRPASQASFHSEPAAYSPYYSPVTEPNAEQPEDGPPKKRARITKAKRPRKTPLGTNAESLRVTASTAASVRLHRPTPLNAGAAVSAEQVPRAPTPRPRNAGSLPSGSRVPAPSLLRNASMDENRPYHSPYDSGIFSDNALDSADDNKGDSPEDTTPPNLPSSPPVLPERIASPAPSSPELPVLPPNDSGFVSDVPIAQMEEEGDPESTLCEKRDSTIGPEVRTRKKPDRSKRSWSEFNPGPVELLPSSCASKHRTGSMKRQPEPMPIDPGLLNHFLNHVGPTETQSGYQQSIQASAPLPNLPPTDTVPFNQSVQDKIGPSPLAELATEVPEESASSAKPDTMVANRASTPQLPVPVPKPAVKGARGLARSQTWSGEPMSDAAAPGDSKGKQPRSGSGAKRKQREIIKEKLEQAIEKGFLPQFCNNCGQIETPAWRRAFTRIEMGTPDHITLSSKGSGIIAHEVISQGDDDTPAQYRIFKQVLEPEEIEGDTFTTLMLCNPCGLWLVKKNAMRPQEVWGKQQGAADKSKRKRKPKKPKTGNDILTSDAVIPESESGAPDQQTERGALPSLDGTSDSQTQPPVRMRSCSFQVAEDPQLDEPAARAALARAIQSSPVGIRRGSRDTPIDLDGDLTPKPTRRLLFPSPRRPGEMKSLADKGASRSPSTRSSAPKPVNPTTRILDVVIEDGDKENCPPSFENEDDIAHLFEDGTSSKTTPIKGISLEDLLKTPTPGSRQRAPLTPMHRAEINLTTPSRSSRTPKANGKAPETPFTRQLNDILSDSMLSGSPSQAFDLSAFPSFNTPGRNNGLQFGDLLQTDLLSSDLPIPSSPPKSFDFSVFEDPNTSTVGLWSGASIFDSDAIMSDAPLGDQDNSLPDGNDAPKILTINGISLDFATMIEDVVGNATSKEQETMRNSSVDVKLNGKAESLGEAPQQGTTSGASKKPELNVSAEPAGSKP
ncbi:hypothetical protein N0V90_001133 [Kalmusia sp. IMI 367209]|nr:hypothetical protein N0V90_001133 [Kalmusia sp. IMI 367209]